MTSDRERRVDALLVVAIIISSSVIILPFIIPTPPPPPEEVTLKILSYFDVWETSEIESRFLSSSFAEEYNIVDIEWVSFVTSMWNIIVGSGSIDLVLGSWEIIDNLGPNAPLVPISQSIASGINDTIAGVLLKKEFENQMMWCSYSIRTTIFELLVNETLLTEFGLEIPESLEDLLSPDYWPEGRETSLIGLDYPLGGSLQQLFQNFVPKALGWECGLQNLTSLYANSRIFDDVGDAYSALLEGEVAITMTIFDGQSWEVIPGSIKRTHLEDLISIEPDVVAISNGTRKVTESEAFIEFLLSPIGQALWIENPFIPLPVCHSAFEVTQAAIDETIYSEFNWTSHTKGYGVSELFTLDAVALGVYLRVSTLDNLANLTFCWSNIVEAYRNSSIDTSQFANFSSELGEPLTFLCPISGENESFSRDYAIDILYTLYTEPYASQLIHAWREAANLRYAIILDNLSLLL